MHDNRFEIEVEITVDLERFTAAIERGVGEASIAARRFGQVVAEVLRDAEKVTEIYQHAFPRWAAEVAALYQIPLWFIGLEGPDLPPSRAEVMRAALEARRNRNTGPPKTMGVPKRLDGKGCR